MLEIVMLVKSNALNMPVSIMLSDVVILTDSNTLFLTWITSRGEPSLIILRSARYRSLTYNPSMTSIEEGKLSYRIKSFDSEATPVTFLMVTPFRVIL